MSEEKFVVTVNRLEHKDVGGWVTVEMMSKKFDSSEEAVIYFKMLSEVSADE